MKFARHDGRLRLRVLICALVLIAAFHPLAAVCFGSDGHVGVDGVLSLHHVTVTSSDLLDERPPATSMAKRVATPLGFCVDVLFEMGITMERQGGRVAMDRDSAPSCHTDALSVFDASTPLTQAHHASRVERLVTSSASVRSLRSTVLRI